MFQGTPWNLLVSRGPPKTESDFSTLYNEFQMAYGPNLEYLFESKKIIKNAADLVLKLETQM